MAFDPNDPDTKAAIKAAIEDAMSSKDDEINAIKENRDKLLKEKKELQKSATITPEQLAAVEGELDAVKAKLTTAEKTAKDAVTASEKATKALATEQGVTHKLLAENGLVAELTKAGITDPDFLDTVTAKHIGSVQIVTEGDNRVAKIGDKPIADFVKEWAGSEAGKKFVAAPNNGGGGAPGSGGQQGNGKTMTRATYDGMSPLEQGAAVRDGTKIVDIAA